MSLKSEPSERLVLRVTRPQKNLIQEASGIQGLSVSAFIIQAASEKAEQVIHQSEELCLGEHDRVVFIQALLNPGKPNAAMRTAAKRYKETAHASRKK